MVGLMDLVFFAYGSLIPCRYILEYLNVQEEVGKAGKAIRLMGGSLLQTCFGTYNEYSQCLFISLHLYLHLVS